MDTLKLMNSKEKKEILKFLNEQFGCDYEFEHEVFMNSKNKLFLINSDIASIDIKQLRVNSMGLYFGELRDSEIRLSIEGSMMIGKIAKKNVLELDDESAAKWMHGEDIMVDSDLYGFVLIKNDGDFLGCGKISNKKLFNYVQKERRV
ncbi:MAG: tRNA pseudouridine(55) synthase TruB [Candidatus Woesearchaeota archaeon]|nr:tRNA pseudouridine(55) synthase TruB [Candidatus Woesearchaeota archaeon]